jgi:hypothetical protein
MGVMHQDDTQHFEDCRKGNSDALLLHIRELQSTVKALEVKMTYHHGVFRDEVEKSVVRVFEHSFPDGDPDGHRKVHEAWIKQAEDKAKFWRTMQTEIAKYGLIGFIGWAGYALWQAFLQGPHK